MNVYARKETIPTLLIDILHEKV